MEKIEAAGPPAKWSERYVEPSSNFIVNFPSLSRWPRPFKWLATCLILTLLVGYGISLMQVFDRSHFSMMKTITYYRGDGAAGEEAVNLPQEYRTMLSIAHVHTFSQPFLFAFLGLIFAFTRVAGRAKSLFIVTAFVGSLISNLTPWLLRYVSPQTVYLFPLSQFAILVSVVVMTLVPLQEMWFKKNRQ